MSILEALKDICRNRSYMGAMAFMLAFLFVGPSHIQVAVQMVILCAAILLTVKGIIEITDLDPKSEKISTTAEERCVAKARLKWIDEQIAGYAQALGIKSLRPAGYANTGIHYSAFSHRVYIPEAHLARLQDRPLSIVLAHEVGHASRRWQLFARVFSEADEIEEEVIADRIAVKLTNATPEEWEEAKQVSCAIDPKSDGFLSSEQYRIRRHAVFELANQSRQEFSHGS